MWEGNRDADENHREVRYTEFVVSLTKIEFNLPVFLVRAIEVL